ncbi:MAG: hypothetical protein JOY71_19360 [Acetobacteraceae bacterium]|nr:hypothetical protein [Acetobacteraceae bacterium]MBV8524253.1 hypothetical protein [Acetobacteraceae bacterium]MBV8590926.1 hypothetical protein [Acetobacteraceae bacterium]
MEPLALYFRLAGDAAGALMLSLVIGSSTWRALQDSDPVTAQSRRFNP